MGPTLSLDLGQDLALMCPAMRGVAGSSLARTPRCLAEKSKCMSEPIPESPPYRTDVRSQSRYVVVGGLLASLLASAAWISFPVGTVPVTLQVFVVILVALLLPPRWAVSTIGIYLLLGALGAPVFASGRAGLGVLFGPTGGYLFGFLIGATLGSGARISLVRAGTKDTTADVVAALVALAVIYVCGWIQLALVTGMGALPAFVAGVAPFIAIDAVKAAIAVGVASVLRRVGVAADY